MINNKTEMKMKTLTQETTDNKIEVVKGGRVKLINRRSLQLHIICGWLPRTFENKNKQDNAWMQRFGD